MLLMVKSSLFEPLLYTNRKLFFVQHNRNHEYCVTFYLIYTNYKLQKATKIIILIFYITNVLKKEHIISAGLEYLLFY